MEAEQEKKIQRALRLIRSSAPKDGSPLEVAYSGGKDSDVILQLVRESGVNYRAIYRNTTIDPKGTIKHAENMGAEMIRPEKTFFELIRQNGMPNRFYRYCCSKLKEFKILDVYVIGIRREESTKRANRYKEPTECRIYGSKKNNVQAIYPILDWSAKDVEDFITDRGIICAPLYYDEKGAFHVERRLGCMCCPLQSRTKRIEQFKKLPLMVRAYCKNAQIYLNNNKQTKVAQQYENAFEWFCRELFFDSMEDFNKSRDGMFDKPDYKRFLEDYFKVKL